MNLRLCLFLLSFAAIATADTNDPAATNSTVEPAANTANETSRRENPRRLVYVIPVREDIMPPLLYIVRRGVKEAMEAGADTLVLDMDTNGGRSDVMQEIIGAINEFEGMTVTYVNTSAFSAGALIAVATEKIYMAPQSVIGAAAPIMMTPGGGASDMPSTMEAKAVSAISALVRAQAEEHGHNTKVVEAMINKGKKLEIDGEVIAEEGEILTLTNKEAARQYGDPPAPLLSSGTVDDLDALMQALGLEGAERVEVKPTGAERIASYINSLSSILLIIGILGLYIEFKTPGFGLPGIVGIIAFSLYFFGSYIAGLSGVEWLAVFLLGILLVAIELFLIPGTVVVGLVGAALMLVSLLMAMVDRYPGGPTIPPMIDLQEPLENLAISVLVAIVLMIILAKLLPKTSIYSRLVSQTESGSISTREAAAKDQTMVGQQGIAISSLRPSGKAQFGEQILDVITCGEMLNRGQPVRITSFSGASAVVEPIDEVQ